MTLETFFEKFDQFADAPDAVAKMRELVLELAVQGRLASALPSDGAVPSVIEFRESAAALANSLGLRSPKETVEEAETPFDVPSHWRWLALADIGAAQTGTTPSKADHDAFNGDIPFIKPADILPSSIDYSNESLTRHGAESGSRLAPSGTLLMVCIGTIGKCNLIERECAFNQQINSLTPVDAVDSRYLLVAVRSRSFQDAAWKKSSSTTIAILNKGKWLSIPVPLPPLAEQKRIVAKVDELMALCDRLEAQQQERETRHAALAQASLARFADAPTPANLPFLFHLSYAIPPADLRKSILTLAVQGKLVPQDPNDEPADVFLGQIAERLGKPKGKRRSNDGAARGDEAKPFDLPPGWGWSRFPDLGQFGRGKSKHRPRNDPSLFVAGTHRLVQTGDVARANGTIQTHTGLYNDAGLSQSKKWPTGTLCITIAANIADSGILGFDACFPDSIVGFIPAEPIPSVRYFEFFMRTAKDHLEQFAPATAQKNINLGILEQVWIPIPPLAEQRRIVAKVEQLMALVDALETQLAASRATAANLLTALVAELTTV